MFALITAVSLLGLVGCQSCDDISAEACLLLSHQRNICQDPVLSRTACPRFCANCPLKCYHCDVAVTDPGLCNTTVACQSNQMCMLRELRAFDGRHQYIMGCEQKEICDGSNVGFVLGKREMESEQFVQSRDVSLTCCTKDLCNFPMQKTPLPPTESTTKIPTITTTTKQSTVPSTTIPKTVCMKDIVFILDDSNSIGSTNFQLAKQFVADVVSRLEIGTHGTQVALLTFDSRAHSGWYLNTYHDLAGIMAHMRSIPYRGIHGSDIGDALEYVREHIFATRHGDRTNAKNEVVLITDSYSRHFQAIMEADRLHTISHITTIGVGNQVSQKELDRISTDSRHELFVQTYSMLGGLKDTTITLLC